MSSSQGKIGYTEVQDILAQDAHKISALYGENDRLRRKAKAHKKSIHQLQTRLHTLKLENEQLKTNLKSTKNRMEQYELFLAKDEDLRHVQPKNYDWRPFIEG